MMSTWACSHSGTAVGTSRGGAIAPSTLLLGHICRCRPTYYCWCTPALRAARQADAVACRIMAVCMCPVAPRYAVACTLPRCG